LKKAGENFDTLPPSSRGAAENFDTLTRRSRGAAENFDTLPPYGILPPFSHQKCPKIPLFYKNTIKVYNFVL